MLAYLSIDVLKEEKEIFIDLLTSGQQINVLFLLVHVVALHWHSEID